MEHLLNCVAMQGHLYPERDESLNRYGVMFPMTGGKLTGECDATSLSPEQPQLDRVPPLPAALISLLLRAQFSI